MYACQGLHILCVRKPAVRREASFEGVHILFLMAWPTWAAVRRHGRSTGQIRRISERSYANR